MENLNNITKTDKDSYLFFNPTEWEIQSFIYGNIEIKQFLSETELLKCIKNLNSNN
jgi:hypothetical protein